MIFVLGSKGQVGSCLSEILNSNGIEFKHFSRDDFDFTDFNKLKEVIRESKPDLIVNCAAFTNVAHADNETQQCSLLNEELPFVLATEQKRHGGALIHYSTDYVFDGLNTQPYKESDETNPINTYGRSKLNGEQKVLESKCAAIILRTGWVYSQDPKCFPVKIANKLIQDNKADVVIDQYGTPNSAKQIAEWTYQLIRKGHHDLWAFCYRYRGIYHLSCSDNTSWYDFALEVCKLLPTRKKQTRLVYPVFSSNYPSNNVKRPGYSVLNCDKFFNTFNLKNVSWKDCFLDEMGEFFRSMELPVVARKKKLILPFTRDELIKLRNKHIKNKSSKEKPKKTRRK